MDKVTATDFARNLSDYLNRVRYRDESFVVERNREPVAIVTPPGAPPPVHVVVSQPTQEPSATLAEVAQRLAGVAWPGDGFAEDLLWARDRRSRA
ncbi:MAG: type II toxin-antitoxin system Phd/YefM family antitoxin [Chloroflexi bacterium]|nr:type II toxin-antitoxin system Phd/YefM family antitoxin [Chloroflexota bacterium]